MATPPQAAGQVLVPRGAAVYPPSAYVPGYRCRGEAQFDEAEGGRFTVRPACFRSNPPELVWEKFRFLRAGGQGTLDGIFYPG